MTMITGTAIGFLKILLKMLPVHLWHINLYHTFLIYFKDQSKQRWDTVTDEIENIVIKMHKKYIYIKISSELNEILSKLFCKKQRNN